MVDLSKFTSNKFKNFIDDITVDLQFFRNFASMEYIRRRCNLMVNLSKFTFNKKILSICLDSTDCVCAFHVWRFLFFFFFTRFLGDRVLFSGSRAGPTSTLLKKKMIPHHYSHI